MPLLKRAGLYLGSAISVILLAAIVFPAAVRAPKFHQEMAVVKAIATIHTAQTQYFSEYGRYASSLAELGPGTGDANLIDKDLARGEKGGFEFRLQAAPAGYSLVVTPLRFGLFAGDPWYTDQDMTIHRRNGKEAATLYEPLLSDPLPHHSQM